MKSKQLPMREGLSRLKATFAAALLITMCGCHSPSQYTCPRITGRVVDEHTKQPLGQVEIRRASDTLPTAGEPQKGAQRLMAPVPVVSGADGAFVLESERVVAFLRKRDWYAVKISFGHPGYETLIRTFSIKDSTNSPSGEPIVAAGDILLQPIEK